MARASDLSPEYVVMGYLVEGPGYGYQLHRRAEQDFSGIWRMSQSQCYNILNRLQAQGDISGETVQQPHGPDKHLYHLTAPGKGRFDEWLDTPTPASARAIRVEFLARLFFAHGLDPEKPVVLIDEQQVEIASTITRLDRQMSTLSKSAVFQRLSLQLRLEQLRSCVVWLDDCRNALADNE